MNSKRWLKGVCVGLVLQGMWLLAVWTPSTELRPAAPLNYPLWRIAGLAAVERRQD